jgi:S1-C subfamily serine protease
MQRARRLFRTPFGSALLGGLVVGLFGWVAISAGWVEAEDGATTTVAAPIATPVADRGDDSNLVNEIYRRDGQGVAFIQAEQPAQAPSPFDPFGQSQGGVATGSGFVIDTEGHVLTNSHVVDGAKSIEVKLGSSDATHSAEVVGADPATDLALLKVDAPADQLHPLALGSSSKVQVGDPVVAIGNPFGLDRTVTSGIVSALQRQIQAPNGFAISNVIQTDAAINPGNSGGPLIDSTGSVIGINSQIETGGGGSGNVGIGFAVPIDTARDVVEQLKSDGTVEHAYLGISGATINQTTIVRGAVAGGPAAKSGVEAGDVIVAVDGEKISSMDEVIDAVNAAEPGEEMDLTVLRGGEEKSFTVTLGDRPE